MSSRLSITAVSWLLLGTAMFLVLFATGHGYSREPATEITPVWLRIHWHGNQDKPPPTIWISASPRDRAVEAFEHVAAELS